jgi:ADP-heptose:LPS heptosyltransferase
MRIAIYRTSSLGDVVLGFACLELLQKLQVQSEVTWVGRGPTLELIKKGWPAVRTIAVARTDTMTELQRVAEEVGPVHLFIDLQCNLRSRYIGRALKKLHSVPVFSSDKAQIRRNRLLIEAKFRGRRKPLPDTALEIKRLQYNMMLDALKKGLRHHLPENMRDDMVTFEAKPKINIPPDGESDLQPWRQELRFGPWLAVAPGASTETKRAPKELFLEVLQKVRENLKNLNSHASKPLGLVFLGDEADRIITRSLMDELSWEHPVLNLSGKLTLWESTVALSECSTLLSNDSSLGHIAEAVGTPTAILFGPTIESFGFAPQLKKSRAFSTKLGCRPCSKHGKASCRFGDKLCFHAIPTTDIAEFLVTSLTAPTARHHLRDSQNSSPGLRV